MRPEDYIRKQIRRILTEKSVGGKSVGKKISKKKTSRAGGGVRKEFRQMKAKSETDPKALMSDLGVTTLKDGEKHDVIKQLLNQAIGGNETMGKAYSVPELVGDEFNREGAVIKVISGDVPIRDGMFFLRHTVRGARKAGVIPFEGKINIEILGDSIVVYADEGTYTWNESPKTEKKGNKKPEEKKDEEK